MSVCARVCGRALWSCSYWFQALSMYTHKRKLKAEFLQEGSPAVEAIWKLLCLTGLSRHFLMSCNLFFLYFPPFYLIFHAGMEEEKALLWIKKDCLPLIHGPSFAFLRFCVGSQELQSIIKPAPCISDLFTVSGWRGHAEFPRLWCQCLRVVWNSLGLGFRSRRA